MHVLISSFPCVAGGAAPPPNQPPPRQQTEDGAEEAELRYSGALQAPCVSAFQAMIHALATAGDLRCLCVLPGNPYVHCRLRMPCPGRCMMLVGSAAVGILCQTLCLHLRQDLLGNHEGVCTAVQEHQE